MYRTSFSSYLFVLVITGCAVDEIESTDDSALFHASPRLVQPGDGLVPLGVTGDRHAIYSDGAAVYVTALRPGANARKLAAIPEGGSPFVKISGDVAFVWPDAGAGASPLVVWSARYGAREAASAAAVLPLATEASSDGRRIVFVGNAGAGGGTGDLVTARANLEERETLAAGLDLAACSPNAGFARDLFWRERPVAAYCPPGAAAQLAVWHSSTATTLVPSLVAPLLTVSRDGRRLYVIGSDPATGARQAVIATASGFVRVVDRGTIGSGFWADDTLVYVAIGPAGRELRRAAPGATQGTTVSTSVATFSAFRFGVRDSAVSYDGAQIPFVTSFDPATGIADQRLLGVETASVTTVEGAQQTLLCNVGTAPTSAQTIPFTRSGAFVYAQRVDPATFLSPLAVFDERGARTFSDDLGLSCAPAAGSLVVFNDRTNDTFTGADLRFVDVDADVLAPRTIREQAAISFVVTEDGNRVVFATGPGDTKPGLYTYTLPGCED